MLISGFLYDFIGLVGFVDGRTLMVKPSGGPLAAGHWPRSRKCRKRCSTIPPANIDPARGFHFVNWWF